MEGAVVARAQAYAAERELPFAVLAELIKQLTLQRAIGGAAPEALSELARVAPEILQAFPGVPRPLEWAAEVVPLRLADAVLKALELLTKEWVAHGARSLLSDLEAVNTQPAARVGIPRAIAAVFERQVPRLERAARAALDLAAVLGRRLADLPLYEVVGLSPPSAGEALSRLLEEGLLREVRWGLAFRHGLLPVAAYRGIRA